MSSQKHAILAGTSEFPSANGRLAPLPAAAANVDALEATLSDPALGGFANVHVTVDLPHWDIMTRANQVLRDARRDDLVLLYYAGYALVSRSGSMLLATINTDPTLAHATALPTDSVRSVFSETECRRIVVIFDCVYQFEADHDPADRIIGLDVSQGSTSGYTIGVMTTSTRMTTPGAWATGDLSVVTDAILRGVTTGGGDRNQDGVITVEELFDFTCGDLRRQGLAEPHLFKTGTTGSLVLSHAPHPEVHEKVVSRIRHRLTRDRLNAGCPEAIFRRAEEILALPEETVTHDHEAVFALLRDWEQDRISLEQLTDQWYQFDDTRLAATNRSSEVEEITKHWAMIRQCRLPVHDLIGPSYLLDANFHFIDWNPMFDELIAKPMGLTRFRHAQDFVLKLKNHREVIERSQREFSEENVPLVDVEDLEYESPAYGLIRFKKIASQIPAERGNLLAWSVQLNITSADRADEMWDDLRARLSAEVNWSTYARLYDDMLLEFDGYRALVERMVSLVGEAESVADLGAGTGNGTAELVRQRPEREVWAFEANEEMMNQLYRKISDSATQARVKCFKGDLMLSLRECDEDRFDAALMLNVLYAIPDRGRCLREIYRVLQPGGVLVYSTSTSETNVDRLFAAIRENLEGKGVLDGLRATVDGAYDRHRTMLDDIHRDSPDDVVAYAVQAGFEVADVQHGEYEGAVSIVRAVKPKFVSRASRRSPDRPRPPRDHREPPCIFICYAREDAEWCEHLKRQLEPARRSGRVEVWADTEIHAGHRWEEEISAAINRSALAVLLVTSHSLRSDFINTRELPRILSRGIDLVPVLVEPALADQTVISYEDPASGETELRLSSLHFETYQNKPISLADKPHQNVFVDRLARMILDRVLPPDEA